MPFFCIPEGDGEPVEIIEIPGDHTGMMAMPHVRGLAERLKACMERTGK